MFRVFSWVMMISLGAAGALYLQQQTDPANLIGEWQLDARRTFSFHGVESTPELDAELLDRSKSVKLVINADGTISSFKRDGAISSDLRWSPDDADSAGRPSTMLLFDETGAEVNRIEWILLDANQLKITRSDGTVLIFARQL